MASYDFVAIGGGNAGLSAAYRVAQAGKRVALVDRGPIGGLCSLAGCNPKKVLVRATEVLDEVRRAGCHGIHAGKISIDWTQVWKRKHSFTDPVPARTEESLAKRGIEFIAGEARFVAPDALEVAGRVLRADGFAVATGSHPRRLNFPGAERIQTTDEVLELTEPPGRMVIVGGGIVAFEFGHVFARLGTRVTILLRRGRALAGFDEDFIQPVLELTRGLGIELLMDTSVRAVAKPANGKLRVDLSVGDKERSLEADFILNAAGRVAAVEALDLGRAGAQGSERGVSVDEFLRSPGNRRIFAGGDAHGHYQLSPIASYEGRVIARNFLEGDIERADYSVIPRAVFTVPPIAAVGLTEEQARRAGKEVSVGANDMRNWTVYAIAGEQQAHSKTVVERQSGRILGAQLFGAGSAEIIHVFAMALRAQMTAAEFKNMVFAYPTLSSALDSTLPS